MIIGSCGYGSTGSSVLTDLLKEYDEIQVFDRFEFVLPYRVDGLEDLEYRVVTSPSRFSGGDYAIKRFLQASKCYKTPFINKPCNGKTFYKLSLDYINAIKQLSFKGIETADVLSGNIFRNINAFFWKKIGMKFFEKLLRRRLYWWPSRTLYYAVRPDNFYKETKKYIENIFIAMGADLNRPICLDQPFEGNNPENSMKFFNNPIAFVIDRDPRDLFLQYKYSKSVDSKFMPHSTVEDFIIYYKNMRINGNNNSKENIIHLNFEEFIYEYDKTIEKIEKVLNLSVHNNPKLYFNPSLSINNTQLIRKHPEDIENIKKIEAELSEFLFPFEKYENVIFSGKSFTGSGQRPRFEKE